MDKLEKFIVKNKEQFDVYEPNPELWNKINTQKKEAKIKTINWKGVLWKAATVSIIFALSFLLQEYLHRNVSHITRTEQDDKQTVPELLEAEIYYTTMVNNKLTELKKYTTAYPNIEQELNYDLSELNDIYDELKEDFKDDIANDEIIEAMIQNYRLRLKILEDLLYEVKKVENNSNNNVQKVEI